MRRHANAGFTLAEIIVATAILGFVIILYGTSQGLIGHYTTKSSDSEKLQQDELNRRLDFIIESRFRAALDLSSDEKLKKCLTIPCTPGCENQHAWVPIAWKNIPLYRYKHPPTFEWVYVEGAHRLKDWSACAPLPKPEGHEHDDTIPPRFPDNCLGFSSAHWRAGTNNAAEIWLQLRIPTSNLERSIRYYVPFATNDSRSGCRPHGGLFCYDFTTYLLRAHPDAGTALCGDPQIQGGM